MNYEDLKDYFSFSKKEKKGISVLLFFILTFTILNWLTPYFLKNELPKIEVTYTQFQNIEFVEDKENSIINSETTDDSKWREVENDFTPQQDSFEYRKNDYPRFEKKFWKKLNIPINTCDSAELTAIRGIGPWTASKIIRNRNKWGGFYSFEQLQFLKPEVLDSIKTHCIMDTENIHWIEINNLPDSVIRFSNSLNFTECKAVLAYRKQHGNFKTCSDLKKCLILTDDQIDKLCPYLKFE